MTTTHILAKKLQAEIKRLGCDYEAVGPYDCIAIVTPESELVCGDPSKYKISGFPINLADDYHTTNSLNVEETVENLVKLPNKAGLKAFWAAVVDTQKA